MFESFDGRRHLLSVFAANWMFCVYIYICIFPWYQNLVIILEIYFWTLGQINFCHLHSYMCFLKKLFLLRMILVIVVVLLCRLLIYFNVFCFIALSFLTNFDRFYGTVFQLWAKFMESLRILILSFFSISVIYLSFRCKYFCVSKFILW